MISVVLGMAWVAAVLILFCVCHSEQIRDRMLHCMDWVAGGRPKPEADCHEPQLLARLRLQGTASWNLLA